MRVAPLALLLKSVLSYVSCVRRLRTPDGHPFCGSSELSQQGFLQTMVRVLCLAPLRVLRTLGKSPCHLHPVGLEGTHVLVSLVFKHQAVIGCKVKEAML